MHVTTFPYLYLIPLFPLLGAVYNALVGPRVHRRWGEGWVHWPAVVLPWMSFVVVAAAFAVMVRLPAGERNLHQVLWRWIHVGAMDADLAFWMDPLSLVMCFVVTFVGSLIHVYATGYMHGDPGYWRFFSFFNLFLFSMLMLVLGDNFLLMFIGWEGVGLCSYLLISFWYTEHKNAVAGMKAFVVNRIGDFGFLVGLFLLFWGLSGDVPSSGPREGLLGGERAIPVEVGAPGFHAGGTGADAHSGEAAHRPGASLTFRKIEHALEDPSFRDGLLGRKVLGASLLTVVCLCLFVGAMGKSAQIPLHVWLPDAMAGPTPVSALIHAATMVTAGVYMVARLHFLFALSPFALTWVAVFGAVTALFAATIGLFQYDIKRVLAYSTVSQLGFMFMAVGVGAFGVGIFHLMTHAFFKACLFLGSGSVILACHHEQDMQKMGGLAKYMPITNWTYFAACAAIAGFPFLSGFFSKDEILWKAFDSGNMRLPGGGFLIWLLGAAAAICTSFYMFRSYYMTFSGSYRGGHSGSGHGHGHDAAPKESPRNITTVLAILGVLSIVGGYVGLPHLWNLPNLFERWLEPVFESSHGYVRAVEKGDSAEWGLMLLSVVIALGGFVTARSFYQDARSPIPGMLKASRRPAVQTVYRTVFNKYYVDEFYQATVVRFTMFLVAVSDWIDRNIVDGLVNLVGAVGRALGFLAGAVDLRGVDGAVNGTAQSFLVSGAQVRKIQTGRLRSYLLAGMAGTLVLVVINYLILK
jgi:NADH-quinone oxidoreductase subunit L